MTGGKLRFGMIGCGVSQLSAIQHCCIQGGLDCWYFGGLEGIRPLESMLCEGSSCLGVGKCRSIEWIQKVAVMKKRENMNQFEESFLVMDQLMSWGWPIANHCCLYPSEKELANHILIHCSLATVKWHLLLSMFSLSVYSLSWLKRFYLFLKKSFF